MVSSRGGGSHDLGCPSPRWGMAKWHPARTGRSRGIRCTLVDKWQDVCPPVWRLFEMPINNCLASLSWGRGGYRGCSCHTAFIRSKPGSLCTLCMKWLVEPEKDHNIFFYHVQCPGWTFSLFSGYHRDSINKYNHDFIIFFVSPPEWIPFTQKKTHWYGQKPLGFFLPGEKTGKGIPSDQFFFFFVNFIKESWSRCLFSRRHWSVLAEDTAPSTHPSHCLESSPRSWVSRWWSSFSLI